jgi:hypothetical protein
LIFGESTHTHFIDYLLDVMCLQFIYFEKKTHLLSPFLKPAQVVSRRKQQPSQSTEEEEEEAEEAPDACMQEACAEIYI